MPKMCTLFCLVLIKIAFILTSCVFQFVTYRSVRRFYELCQGGEKIPLLFRFTTAERSLTRAASGTMGPDCLSSSSEWTGRSVRCPPPDRKAKQSAEHGGEGGGGGANH